MTASFKLGVLDQSPIAEGGPGAQALRNTIELACRAEELGYGRYWVAEHHGTPMLACAAPEILVGAIAAATSRIRVGSGGVMISHYSPFKVAEVFSVLGALHGKRIDLGIGRAPGTDRETIAALQRDRRQFLPDDFIEQVAELLAYFDGGFPDDHPFARLTRLPGAPGSAEVWMLGTSVQSATWAADLGLPYGVADFINPGSADSARRYRERFTASRHLKRPLVAVGVGVVCAETDEEARRQASSWQMAITLAERGQFAPLPPVTKALAFQASEREPLGFAGRRVVVGSPETVRNEVEQIAVDYGADEVLLHTLMHSHAARLRSYELLAAAFGLGSTGERHSARKRR
ncbi:MAG: LLM class flavin-dependent oxidoreductase [Actinomycetes bacterium]